MNFDHIDHQITREVLALKSIDEDSICQALTFAEECLQADQHNEDVQYAIYDIRDAALEDAKERWNAEGDIDGCIDSLRQFWAV